METAAAVEIDQGGLRRYFLEDFHRCLEKPRTTLGFSTVTTGSAAINQKPTTNKTGRITCYQNRTFLLATDIQGVAWVSNRIGDSDRFSCADCSLSWSESMKSVTVPRASGSRF